MRIPIPRTGRRPRLPPEKTAPPNRSARSCRWSSSAKGVFDPNDTMRAVGQPLDGEYVEAHRMAAPLRVPLQKESGGADDFALLAPGDRRKRSAEIDPRALPHFDDGEHAEVEAHEIEFAGSAPCIACEHAEAVRLQIFRRESLGRGTALKTGVGGHAPEIARARRRRQH